MENPHPSTYKRPRRLTEIHLPHILTEGYVVMCKFHSKVHFFEDDDKFSSQPATCLAIPEPSPASDIKHTCKKWDRRVLGLP